MAKTSFKFYSFSDFFREICPSSSRNVAALIQVYVRNLLSRLSEAKNTSGFEFITHFTMGEIHHL